MSINAKLHRADGSLTTLSNGRHVWQADIAKDIGGSDAAPDPHDLLDSALAACTALTLELYIRRKQLPVTAIEVQIEHQESPGRYELKRQIRVEGEGLAETDRQRLLEIAKRCPIHRLLEGEILIESELLA